MSFAEVTSCQSLAYLFQVEEMDYKGSFNVSIIVEIEMSSYHCISCSLWVTSNSAFMYHVNPFGRRWHLIQPRYTELRARESLDALLAQRYISPILSA